MKLIRFFLMLVMTLLVLPISAQRFADILKRAYDTPNKVYQYYVQGKADSIWAMGSSNLKGALTAGQLAEAVASLEAQLGKPLSAEPWTVSKQMGISAFTRRVRFANYSAILLVGLNEVGEVEAFTLTGLQPLASQTLQGNELKISIRTGDITLPGILTRPAQSDKQPVPVAILVHGSGPSNMDETVGPNKPFADLAQGLAKRGIAVIRYDKRTKVYPDRFMPGMKGDYDSETVDDALSAIALAKNMQGIDSSRVFIVGHSLGAMLAPRIAERARNVAGIICMAAPTLKLPDMMKNQLEYLGMSKDSIAQTISQLKASLPMGYLAFDDSYSPTATAKRLTLPMLLLQGGRDYQVTMDDFARWKKVLAGHKNARFKAYPQLNHLFMEGKGKSTPDEYMQPGHVADGVINDISDFILSIK